MLCYLLFIYLFILLRCLIGGRGRRLRRIHRLRYTWIDLSIPYCLMLSWWSCVKRVIKTLSKPIMYMFWPLLLDLPSYLYRSSGSFPYLFLLWSASIDVNHRTIKPFSYGCFAVSCLSVSIKARKQDTKICVDKSFIFVLLGVFQCPCVNVSLLSSSLVRWSSWWRGSQCRIFLICF